MATTPEPQPRIAPLQRVSAVPISDPAAQAAIDETRRRMAGEPLRENAYRFVFPELLPEPAWTSERAVAVELQDAREAVRWYFQEMTGGASYEWEINQPWNTSTLNSLTEQNFRTARLIGSMGWSYKGVEPLAGRVLPELEAIPPWADLFETTAYDTALSRLVFSLVGQPGTR